MSHGGDGELPEEHEEHVNHEAWVIPYADLLTLLMAMFIALFAMSTVDVSKFKAFAIGFNEALGGGKLDAAVGGAANATSSQPGSGSGNGPFNGGMINPSNGSPTATQLQQLLSSAASNQAQGAAQHQTLEDLQRQIVDAANRLGLGEEVRTKQLNNGLQVTLLTDQVLFASGHADLQPTGLELLSAIAAILKSVDNSININGYTDDVPIGPGGQFPSNLYLSSFRADAVADYFTSVGVDRSRLFPAGRGDQDFIASNATAAGRAQNRRVEIVVVSKLIKQTLDQAGLDNKAVTPSTLPIKPISGATGSPSVTNPDIKPNLAGN
jgi:chemotaxis protein MotB